MPTPRTDRLGAPLPTPRGRPTQALRRIQLAFWVTTVTIVGLFAFALHRFSLDHLETFTAQALSLERRMTASLVAHQLEEFLSSHGYSALLPGKGDAELEALLDRLVESIPGIHDVRVVTPERFLVAAAGIGTEETLGPDRRDRCCSVLGGLPVISASGDLVPGDLLATGEGIIGRFHDPEHLGLFCIEGPLVVRGSLIGHVAVHEDNPLSQRAFETARADYRLAIFAASALLLGALLLTVVWTSRELHRLEERLARGERQTSLLTLAAGVAHEVRNPLNTIALSVGWLRRQGGERPPEVASSLELIAAEVERLRRTIDGFIALARRPRLRLAPTQLPQIVDDTIAILRPELEAAGVEVTHRTERLPPLEADEERLRGAVLNLVRNAMQSIVARGGHGAITVTTRQGSRAHLELEVADDGTGIAPEALPRIFEPYFTTRDDGLGLGLTLVQQDIVAHGGTITATSLRPRGAAFVVRLPIAGPAEGGGSLEVDRS